MEYLSRKLTPAHTYNPFFWPKRPLGGRKMCQNLCSFLSKGQLNLWARYLNPPPKKKKSFFFLEQFSETVSVCLWVIFCLSLTCKNWIRISVQFELSAIGKKRDAGKRPNVLARNASLPDNPRSAARRAAQDLVIDKIETSKRSVVTPRP